MPAMNRIKIAHISPAANSESSAANRIRISQQKHGLDAFSVVHSAQLRENVLLFIKTKFISQLSRLFFTKINRLPLIFYPLRKNLPFSFHLLGYPISHFFKSNRFDIVNLHWVTAGTVSFSDLKRIKSPVVWTLHDVHLLTGGCHCNLNCEQWKSSCTHCPQLGKPSAPLVNFPQYQWNFNKKSIQEISNLTIIAPSRWLYEMCKAHPSFQQKKVVHIPNCIDTNIFQPISALAAREQLGLPVNKKMILFGAVDAFNVKYKGFHFLLEALQQMGREVDTTETILVIFGTEKETLNLPFETIYLGNIDNQEKMNLVYNAANVFVSPSMQDNLSNTLIEASSCGTPSICFNIGGNSDIVVDGETGLLVTPFNTTILAQKIQSVLTNESLEDALGKAAREHCVAHFSEEIVFSKYYELYCGLLESK
jgi:glycosyltransferase involved in cell wall biosynthesis